MNKIYQHSNFVSLICTYDLFERRKEGTFLSNHVIRVCEEGCLFSFEFSATTTSHLKDSWTHDLATIKKSTNKKCTKKIYKTKKWTVIYDVFKLSINWKLVVLSSHSQSPLHSSLLPVHSYQILYTKKP